MAPAAINHYYEIDLFALPENFLQVTDPTLYNPLELQSGIDVPKLSNGVKDAMALLYTDDLID